MFFYKTPSVFKMLAPGLTWNKPNNNQLIYLTFDDGPVQGVTDWVLELLDKKKVKATFFCVGENINRNTPLFVQIVKAGHSVGNHTFNHLDGWKTTSTNYVKNTEKCAEVLATYGNNRLFRPPHGRLKPHAIRLLKATYDIIMWDVLVGDYRKNCDPVKSIEEAEKAVNPGSIIVFHDSKKSESNMKAILPRFIDKMHERNFQFSTL